METPTLRTARLENIQKLTTTVYVFTVSFPNSFPLQFQAGQYGTFIIDSATRRQYSFCSSPKDTHTVNIVVDTKPMGPGSTYFLGKKVGDTMQFLAPLGTFVLVPSPRKKIMVATGTGIAPLKSMILDVVEEAEIQLLWGLRHEEDIYWEEELQIVSKQYPTFSYMLTLSQPGSTWSGLKGRVTDHIEEIVNMQAHDYYLCGNKNMIIDVKTTLLAHNIPEGHIKTELF